MTEKQRPKTGGEFKREADGSLTRTDKPQVHPEGGGPRNSKGVPIDDQHRELNNDGSLKKPASKPSSSSDSASSKSKGGK